MHCEEYLPPHHKIFCENCFLELECFSLGEDRCLNCFNLKEDFHKACRICEKAIFTALLAVFPLNGATLTLHAKLKTIHGSYLCQAASSFMALQIIQAGWPLPDIIIALPQTAGEKLFQNHNYNTFIAKELALLLNRPLVNPFRFNLKKLDFSCIKQHVVENKNLLVVADILPNKGKLHACAEILVQGYPKNIYGIALCQTE